jgi:hypothetical protein
VFFFFNKFKIIIFHNMASVRKKGPPLSGQPFIKSFCVTYCAFIEKLLQVKVSGTPPVPLISKPNCIAPHKPLELTQPCAAFARSDIDSIYKRNDVVAAMINIPGVSVFSIIKIPQKSKVAYSEKA